MTRTILFLGLSAAFWLPEFAAGQQFLSKDISAWLTELESPIPSTRRGAAFALGKLGNPSVAPALQNLLRRDPDAKVREASAFALGELAGRLAGDANLAAVLTEAVSKDANALVRRSAAYALGSMGQEHPGAVAALDKALKDQNPGVRQNAAWALGRLGPNGLPGLQKALADPDPLVKRDAAGSLAVLATYNPKAVRPALPELLPLCRVNNSELRRAALTVLIKTVGQEDGSAIPDIKEALQDPDDEVRNYAALTISNIGGPDAVVALPQLIKALAEGEVELRRQAAAALRGLGPHAEGAVPDLVKALSDPDAETRGNAALAIGGIGPGANSAYPHLLVLLENSKERPETRIEAAVAMSRMVDERGQPIPAAIAAVPRLVKILADSSQEPRVRERVIWALRVHNARLRQYPEVGAALARVLAEPKSGRHDNRMLRYDCAYMLGMLQRDKVPTLVLDTLQEFLRDETIQIYVNKKANVQGTGNETSSGKVNVKEMGKGDGRVMAIRALTSIGIDRVPQHRGVMAELRRLAAARNLDPDLSKETRHLLKDLGN